MPKVSLECEQCGDTYEVYPCREDSSSYCSQSCQDKMYEDRTVEYQCDWCGESFEDYLSADRDYCSTGCKLDWMSEGIDYPSNLITVECEVCGDEIEDYPSKIERSDHNLCSNECRGDWISQTLSGPNHPNWAGGYDGYYGPSWHSQRRKALERDGYECVICGKGMEEMDMEPDVHHIKPFRTFDLSRVANRLGNLACLCKSHHKLVESGSMDLQSYLCT